MLSHPFVFERNGDNLPVLDFLLFLGDGLVFFDGFGFVFDGGILDLVAVETLSISMTSSFDAFFSPVRFEDLLPFIAVLVRDGDIEIDGFIKLSRSTLKSSSLSITTKSFFFPGDDFVGFLCWFHTLEVVLAAGIFFFTSRT